jgi:CysZ protein
MSDVARGVYDATRGGRFVLARPRLWVYIAAPAVVTLLILIGVIAGAVALAGPPLAALAAALPGAWAERIVEVALTVVLAVASFTVFLSVAAMIAAPFNEMLSEKIEEEVAGKPGEGFRPLRFLVDLVVGIAHAVRRVVLYLLLVLALLIMSAVIPVIGAIVAAALGAYVTASFAAYDAYDAVWARRRWRYTDKVAYVKQRRWRAIGLVGVVAALMLVPGLNLVALSMGAAGATLAFLDEERAREAAAV